MIRLRYRTMIALMTLLVLLAGCSSEPKAAVQELTVEDILAKSSQKAKDINSLHFKLDSQGGSTQIAAGLSMDAAEGDVVKPDKMKMMVKAGVLGAPLEVKFVSLASETYMTNPLNGKWELMPGGFNPIAFFDPNTGAVNVLDNLKNPEKLKNEAIDGVETYHIKGLVPTSALKSITGEGVKDGEIPTEVWIGIDDVLPRQFRVDGPVMEGEKPNIVRVLRFSNLDQPVAIEAPK